MHVYIGLGSNMGNREQLLDDALAAIYKVVGQAVSCSSRIETAPWGELNQAPFLNQVVCVDTPLPPLSVMAALLHIEQDMGRIRTGKWQARNIDLDIIFYGQLVMDVPGLTLPHPFAHQRAFVLDPIREIAPDFIHPVLGLKIYEINPS